MQKISFIILATDRDFEIIAGLIGILSMIVARLLDWYFPSQHHYERKRKRIREEKETEEAKGSVESDDFEEVEEVEYIEEDSNDV